MSIKSFVQHIEDNIYQKELIYRSILVCKNTRECEILKIMLEKNDHSAMIVDCILENINYNNIDNRIVIMCYNVFYKFIEHLESQDGGLLDSSYNFIAFSYILDTKTVQDLINYYVDKTHNNANNTIILEKKYIDYLYLQQCTEA